jgi:hypothetical protein
VNSEVDGYFRGLSCEHRGEREELLTNQNTVRVPKYEKYQASTSRELPFFDQKEQMYFGISSSACAVEPVDTSWRVGLERESYGPTASVVGHRKSPDVSWGSRELQ